MSVKQPAGFSPFAPHTVEQESARKRSAAKIIRQWTLSFQMLESLSISVPLIGMQIKVSKSIVSQDKRITKYLMEIFWSFGTTQDGFCFPNWTPALAFEWSIKYVGLAFIFWIHLYVLRTYIIFMSLLAISEYLRSIYDFYKYILSLGF